VKNSITIDFTEVNSWALVAVFHVTPAIPVTKPQAKREGLKSAWHGLCIVMIQAATKPLSR